MWFEPNSKQVHTVKARKIMLLKRGCKLHMHLNVRNTVSEMF